MMIRQVFISFILFFSQLVAATIGSTPKTGSFVPPQLWENVQYKRSINVIKSYSYEAIDLVVKNIGEEPNSVYFYGISEPLYEKISMVAAFLPDKNVYIESALYPKKTTSESGEVTCYAVVKFPSPIEPNGEMRVALNFAHNGARKPLVESLPLGAPQKLALTINAFPCSPYKTSSYSLEFITADAAAEVIEGPKVLLDTLNKHDNTIELGPVSDIDQLDKTEIVLSYKRNFPLSRVVHLHRDIWISHWANTAQFEEYYEITNDVSRLKDGFSRVDYINGRYAFQQGSYIIGFEMKLPEDSSGHYYTDKVGMVSTYKVDNDRILLKPRYPIFGGWFYNFTIGWTNELGQFLHSLGSNDEYILRVPMLNGPGDTFYDDVELSVYLPEGSSLIDVRAPLPVVDVNSTNDNSFFDMLNGHVKVTIKCKNLIDNVQQGQLYVKYRYSKNDFYMKPFSITGYIFVAMMGFFFLTHIDVSI